MVWEVYGALGVINSRLYDVWEGYVVGGTQFRALRARGTREAKISHESIVFSPRRFQRAIAAQI